MHVKLFAEPFGVTKLQRFLLIVALIGFIQLVFIKTHITPIKTDEIQTLSIHGHNGALTNNRFHYFIGSEELSSLAAYLLPRNKQYYCNYTCYDFYSVHDIGQSKPRSYWEKFSLDSLMQYPHAKSSSGLAFVESIMVISGKHLTDRHEHLEKVFLRQGIDKSVIEYRWKWDKKNCAAPSNFEYIKSIFPYISGNHSIDVGCATVIEHIDTWYSIAKRNLTFVLVLEDDVVFVPFLKEKFNRFMSEAVKRKLIKVDQHQTVCSSFENIENVTIDELLKNPILTEGIFHFGTCLNLQTPGVKPYSFIDVPRISPYRKYYCGRCGHMYGMSHCAAKMMITALHKIPTRFQWTDWLINHIIVNSPKLIGWWTDPPLGYQTGKIEPICELDHTLKHRTYDLAKKQNAP